MKYLKKFKLFESLDSQKEISIEDYLKEIELDKTTNIEPIIEWWKENRPHIKLYYFNFNSSEPIMGGIIADNTICINKKVQMAPQIKLFIALHESKHIDQHNEGRFEEGYFKTVLNGDKEKFLDAYVELEKEANDFAFQSIKDLNIDWFVSYKEKMLRHNESLGNIIYQMMKQDIERLNVTNFYELIKKQIL
jgi:hypothetical protein